MYTTNELFADPSEWKAFRGTVFNATGEEHDKEPLRILFEGLPRNIRATAHEWGMNDTVFRDDVFVHLQSQRAAG